MQIITLFLLFVICAFIQGVSAQVIIDDPEIDFIQTPESVCAEFGISKKDQILRLELDISGDGGPAVFLTYRGTGSSRAGANWTAYVPSTNGYKRTDGIEFREDSVRAGKVEGFNDSGGLVSFLPGRGGGILFRHRLLEHDGVLVTEEIMEMNWEDPEHVQIFEQVFRRKLDEPMPDEFFKKPSHQVIEVKSIEARAASKPNSDTAETATNETSQKVNSPQFAQPPLKIAPEAKPTASTPSQEPASSTPWSVIAVLIFAAIGLLWLLLKRQTK